MYHGACSAPLAANRLTFCKQVEHFCSHPTSLWIGDSYNITSGLTLECAPPVAAVNYNRIKDNNGPTRYIGMANGKEVRLCAACHQQLGVPTR